MRFQLLPSCQDFISAFWIALRFWPNVWTVRDVSVDQLVPNLHVSIPYVAVQVVDLSSQPKPSWWMLPGWDSEEEMYTA
jgi:hypothetical protein